MSERPWYKRYGGDFVMGTMALSLEEKGAYSLCLDLIYDRGGPIPDDARWLAGICGVSVRKWNAIRAALLEAGKLIDCGGFLSNRRAQKEIENAAKTARKLAENGAKGGNKSAENRANSNKNSDVDEAGLKPNQKPEARTVDKSTASMVDDPDKAAWDLGTALLVQRGGKTEASAKRLFGSFLGANRLQARELLSAIAQATANGTKDPASYLGGAAKAIAARKAEPVKVKRVTYV